MIEQISLKTGETFRTTLNLSQATVFIGPNNSGKSLILREILVKIRDFNEPHNFIVDSIEYTGDQEKIKAFIETFEINPQIGTNVIIQSYMGNSNIDKERLDRIILNPKAYGFDFGHYILKHKCIQLDGNTRLAMSQPGGTQNLNAQSKRPLTELFTNDEKRLKVAAELKEVFNKYFVLDISDPRSIVPSYSETKPPQEINQRSLENAALDFYKKTTPVDHYSDGVKAYTGIVLSASSKDHSLMLIDEPEAFLHPSLQRKIGNYLGLNFQSPERQIICATHSVEFLLGMLQSGINVNVVRLERKGNKTSINVMGSKSLTDILSTPLLRSTGMLNGLFFNRVILCEGDADRCIYNEVAEMIIPQMEGSKDYLFIHTNGKGNISKVARLLIDMGVEVHAIMDFDFITASDTWPHTLSGFRINDSIKKMLDVLRSSILSNCGETKPKDIKSTPAKVRASMQELLKALSDRNIHVVPVGQLENWLLDFDLKRQKNKFPSSTLELLGNKDFKERIRNKDYPDVFQFVERIVRT